MTHVFISYVRENAQEVQRLYNDLSKKGLKVWLDKTELKPGSRWQEAVAEAIDKGDFFLACFSKEYNKKSESYMNEEITLAIERLRQQPRSRAWFIPVLFSGEVPNWLIGAGESLRSLQWVELDENNWNMGIQQILRVIQPTILLRSHSQLFSKEDAKRIFMKKGFFDKNRNHNGPGLRHQYEDLVTGQLIIDHTTDLFWQQSGSPEWMAFDEAQAYIDKLNDLKFSGRQNWRLPTLEEAASLLEPKPNEFGLFIDPIFDKNQQMIWTADKVDRSFAWVVSFYEGGCHYGYGRSYAHSPVNYVRGVCSKKLESS